MEKPSALRRRLIMFRRKGGRGSPDFRVLLENLKFPDYARPSLREISVLCWNNSAERNAGVNYVFAKVCPRIGDLRAAPSVVPCFVTLTGTNDMYLVLEDRYFVFWRLRGWTSPIRGPILRIRNARQSNAASNAQR